MPFKLRAAVRHHIPRQKFRITNWREYEVGLRNRGSLKVWFSNEAIAAWKGLPSGKQGGQLRYSELAIEIGDRNGFDFAGRVSLGAAPMRGSDRLNHAHARARSCCARSYDLEP